MSQTNSLQLIFYFTRVWRLKDFKYKKILKKINKTRLTPNTNTNVDNMNTYIHKESHTFSVQLKFDEDFMKLNVTLCPCFIMEENNFKMNMFGM